MFTAKSHLTSVLLGLLLEALPGGKQLRVGALIATARPDAEETCASDVRPVIEKMNMDKKSTTRMAATSLAVRAI